MNAILTIAVKEVRDGLRNRWVVAATLVLAALALALSFLGSAPTGTVGVPPLTVTVVSLASLTIFLVPLIALLLAYDAIVGEIEHGTMLLLLSYPVARWQVILGKFLGHAALLAIATVLGYGAAGAAVVLLGQGGVAAEGWDAFAALIGTSVLLGMAFVALGYLVSAMVRERATAAGMAVGIWLIFVVLFDLALLGVLAATGGEGLSAQAVGWLLMLNPADAFRLFNLTGFSEVRQFSGMAGLSGQTGAAPAVSLAILAVWVALPLAAAGALFQRRQL